MNAQNVNNAAIFLLQPVGARTVGHGETAVADTLLGTEGLWWNPAGMARNRKREFAVHHTQGVFFSTTDLLAVTIPSRALGTIGAGYFLQQYENTPATNGEGAETGVNTNKYHVLNAGYATPVGKRLSAGVTAKLILIRFLCNGICDATINPQFIGNATAFDVGAQYTLPTRLPVTLGASLRNVGSKLRARDREQADPLPKIIQVGARASLPFAGLAKRSTTLEVMTDVVQSDAYASPSIRFGADLSYKGNYTVRAGYKALSASDGTEKGLTAGFGFRYNSIQLDIARRFDETTANLGSTSPPTYISLRFVF